MLETIVAPATPYGESSIGVIRISGSQALEIVKTLTKTKVFKNRYAHYRKIYLDNDDLNSLGIHENMSINIKKENLKYLKFHREKIFKN